MIIHSKLGYKLTEIGEIPHEWEVRNLQGICEKPEYGYTKSAVDSPIGPRFLRITDIQDGKVNWDNVPYCECTDYLTKKYLLKPGDILFARTGATTGKSYLIRNCPIAVFASYLIRVRSKDDIVPKFLLYFFNSEFYWRQVNKNMIGSAQGGMNASLLSRLKVKVPPFPEQQKIAEILSTVDDAIQKTNEIIEKTQDLKKGLMQKLLTKGIGHTRFKQSKIGEIPEEWEVRNLQGICEKPEYGYTQSAIDRPIGPKFLRITDIQDGKVVWNNVPYCKCSDYLTEKYLLKPGDILFARTGATTGKSYLIRSCPEAVFASYLIRVRTKEDIVPKFLIYFFNSEFYWRQVKQKMIGSAQGGMNASLLLRLNVQVPSLPEQEKICEILSGVDEKIEMERKRKVKLEELKKGLMQSLLTGKVRVKV